MTEQQFERLCMESFTEIYSRAKSENEVQFLTSCFAIYKNFNLNILSYVADYEFNEMLCLLNGFKQIQEINELDLCNKTRIRMFVYCHIMEVDLVYMILWNLLRTIRGKSYSSKIPIKSKKARDAKYPVEKIEEIEKESQAVEMSMKTIYSELYFSHLRNAFSHSQYFLDKDGGFNLTKNLSPATSTVQKKATKKSYYKADEIESIFNKSILYIKAFIENHIVFLKDYADGRHYPTQFGEIYYDHKFGWGFVQAP